TMLAPTSDATLVALRALTDEIVERLADTPLARAVPAIRLDRWSDEVGYVTMALETIVSGNDGIEAILSSLDDFTEFGPDPEELAAAIADIWRWSTDHDNVEQIAENLAVDELRTGRPRVLDRFLAAVDEVTAAEVQQVFAE